MILGTLRRFASLALRAGVLGLALGHVVAVVWVMARRRAFPFELEWMEGAVRVAVERVVRGEPLHSAPTLDFVPFIYGPAWFRGAALWGGVFGTELPALRAFSLLGAAVVAWLIARWVRRRGGGWLGGLVAVGTLAGLWPAGGAWWDLVRVDAVVVALGLGALGAARLGRGTGSALLAGSLLGVAALTKPVFLLAAPALLVGCGGVRRALLLGGGLLGVVAALGLLEQRASGGWAWYYAVSLPWRQGMTSAAVGDLLGTDLPAVAAPLLAAVLGLSAASGPRVTERRRDALLALAAFAPVAIAGRVHPGAWLNALLPLHVAVALAVGLAWGPAQGGLRALVGAAVLLGQLAAWPLDHRLAVPTPDDAAAGQRAVALLGALPPRAWAPYHADLAVRAGRGPQAHWMPLHDVLRVHDPVADALRAELSAALREGRHGALLLDLDARLMEPFAAELDAAYAPPERVAFDAHGWTRTGLLARPELVRRRR